VDESSNKAGRLRVAIVGAGPAGFFTADELLEVPGAEVTLFDRVPTPWGLVRAGVAPDHPNIKSASRTFELIAQRNGFRFAGNVTVGEDVTHEELMGHHHAVVYAHGAASGRDLGIPGEDLPGSYSAADFVAWYNGHPDAVDSNFDLSGPSAVVIGNGNVALDVARMLLLDEKQLRATDASDTAIDSLARSGIVEVVVLGRRGPEHASYTAPVLREFSKLNAVAVSLEPADAIDSPSGRGHPESEIADRKAQQNLEAAQELLDAPEPHFPIGKRLHLKFLRSPTRIVGTSKDTGVEVTETQLSHGPGGDEDASTEPDGLREVIDCSAVFRAIGYHGKPIPGLPFDAASGTIPSEGGRVLSSVGGTPVRGVYVSGWIKRGPSGVIGTNKKCASETAGSLIEDYRAGKLAEPRGVHDELDALLEARSVQQIDDPAWQRIDKHERAKGLNEGRPRVKLVRREDLVEKGLELHAKTGRKT